MLCSRLYDDHVLYGRVVWKSEKQIVLSRGMDHLSYQFINLTSLEILFSLPRIHLVVPI